MKRFIKANKSYLEDQIDNYNLEWSKYDIDDCKEILENYNFTEIVEDTFESQEFDDSSLNDDGGSYVCMLSFRIPEMMIRCRVEDRFEDSSRLASEVTIKNKGGVYPTFRAAIQWLSLNGLPSRLASQIMYDTPVE